MQLCLSLDKRLSHPSFSKPNESTKMHTEQMQSHILLYAAYLEHDRQLQTHCILFFFRFPIFTQTTLSILLTHKFRDIFLSVLKAK